MNGWKSNNEMDLGQFLISVVAWLVDFKHGVNYYSRYLQKTHGMYLFVIITRFGSSQKRKPVVEQFYEKKFSITSGFSCKRFIPVFSQFISVKIFCKINRYFVGSSLNSLCRHSITN